MFFLHSRIYGIDRGFVFSGKDYAYAIECSNDTIDCGKIYANAFYANYKKKYANGMEKMSGFVAALFLQ